MSQPSEWTLDIIGTQEFPRYLISDGEGKCWNGEKWVPKKEAPLYASYIEACRDFHDLLRRSFHTKVPVGLVVPLRIELRSEHRIPPEQVIAWLQKALVLITDFAEHGTGPTPDSVVIGSIDWRELKPALPYVNL